MSQNPTPISTLASEFHVYHPTLCITQPLQVLQNSNILPRFHRRIRVKYEYQSIQFQMQILCLKRQRMAR